MKKQLRPYQEAALKSLFNWLFTPETGNPLLVAPVGSGKSLICAEIIRQSSEMYPRTRIVVLTHVKELLEQNAEELRHQWPDCDFGFYCAGLGQKRLHNDVTFASIQSVAKKINAFNRPPELIIVDECHLISHKSQTLYRKFFDDVLALNPNAKIIGLTGTPFRADTGRLDDGDGALFDGVCYEIEMGYMIEEGYWAKPVTPDVNFKMDVKGVAVRGGDYVAGELEKAVNTHEINDACVRELIEKGAQRKKWLVFTAGVQHCADVLAEIRNAGIEADMVTGETPKQERQEIIEKFRRGDIRCLVNVAVLTTGFNVPDVDLLAFMRPTRSPVLYIQTTGRGVRPVYAPGYDLLTKEGRLQAIANGPKPNCLVLDFGGIIDELGPIDQVNIKKKFKEKEKKEGIALAAKICPSCGAACAPAQKYCYECSYSFISLADSAAAGAIVSMDEPAEWVDVVAVDYAKHVKAGAPDKPPTLKVTYYTTRRYYNEWVCFEHNGYAREKAIAWHNKRMSYIPIPATIDRAIQYEYPKPSRILVKRQDKYWRVLDCAFDETNIENDKITQEMFDIPF